MLVNERWTRSHGFTVLEVIAAVGISVVVAGAAGSAMMKIQSGLSHGTLSATTDEIARRTAQRLVEELRRADCDSIVLNAPTNASSIEFATIDGWDAGGVILSPTKTMTFASGQITLDGTALAGGLGDVTFNFDGATLTVAVEVEKRFESGGASETLFSRYSVQLAL